MRPTDVVRRCPQPIALGYPMWHFVHGRFKEAMFEARKIDMPGVIYPYIMIAASANRLGLSDQATAALDSLIALSPDYGSSVVADLERRNLHPDIISVVVEGLKDAGFACVPAAVPPLKHVPGHL